jgi:uncharacterized protein YcaQ
MVFNCQNQRIDSPLPAAIAKSPKPIVVSQREARRLWLHAQRLDTRAPFGTGTEATRLAVEHLGYVQIDTINVIERCHHHILYSRIPSYRREHLQQAQSVDKSVFEYWTHALAYLPTRDFRFILPAMLRHRAEPNRWNADVERKDLARVLKLVRTDGAITIRDIEEELLEEKSHPWASRKPSKAALQLAFWNGDLAISQRSGMLKTYEAMERHFGWETRPRPATENQVTRYLLDRALRSQALVSVDSICYLDNKSKPAIRALLETEVRARRLKPVQIEGVDKWPHWIAPETLAAAAEPIEPLVHILSPFDPLIIQRKRTSALFGYDHLFEAYVPKGKRVMGYFTLPVLVGDEIVAGIDLKTDRAAGKLLIQKWTWVGRGEAGAHKALIEEELTRFEHFQLAREPA